MMRQILPVITMVILLCLAIQAIINDVRVNAAMEKRAFELRAAYAAEAEAVQAVATTQPATQPVTQEELTESAR